ncbi:phage protease [Citromicrobium bathyomarinum]
MTTKSSTLALCGAIALPAQLPDDGSEWLHLLPGGGVVETEDSRGPYTVPSYDAVVTAFNAAGNPLVVDECHATDLAAPKGGSAPARGWIVALESRDDGIWGKVEWNAAGRQLREDKAYRGISPAILHDKAKRVLAIARASLINLPNLKGLTALHQEETTMDWKAMLIEALGLEADATDEAIKAAVTKKLGMGDEDVAEEALQSALQAQAKPIATALGLQADASNDAIVTAIGQLKSGGNDVVAALQSELTELGTKFVALQSERAGEKSAAVIDKAIREGRVGVKAQRDHYLAMHQENPERTEAIIDALPKVGGLALQARDLPERKADQLDESDTSVIALMGLDPDKFKETRAEELGVTEAL